MPVNVVVPVLTWIALFPLPVIEWLFKSINTLLEIVSDSDNSISANNSTFLPSLIADFKPASFDTSTPVNSQIAFKVIFLVIGVLKSYFLAP